jgi:hypothetical protein
VLRDAREAFEKLPYDDRPATCKEDWKTRPMPRRRTKIVLDISYNADAMTRIRKGFLPTDMGDKWFVWFEEPVLYLHRSWTGFCVYEVNFVPDRQGWRATFALVSIETRSNTHALMMTWTDEWRKLKRALTRDREDTLSQPTSKLSGSPQTHDAAPMSCPIGRADKLIRAYPWHWCANPRSALARIFRIFSVRPLRAHDISIEPAMVP